MTEWVTVKEAAALTNRSRRATIRRCQDMHMTETGLVALVGIVATLGGTLLATWLANRHSSRRARAERSFALQDNVRLLIVNALVEGGAWQTSAHSVGMVSATANNLAEVDSYIKNDLNDSWTGTQIRDHGQAFSRATTELRILVTDSPLRDAILAVEQLHKVWWEEVLDPIRALFKEGNSDPVERLRPAMRFEAMFAGALAELEQRATAVVSDSIVPDP